MDGVKASSRSAIPRSLFLETRHLDGVIEGLFAGEMLEQQGLGYAGGLGQLAGGGSVEALFDEDPPHGLDNGRSPLLAGEFLS